MNIYTTSIFQSRRIIKHNYYFFHDCKKETECLISRLFLQTLRRPANLVAGLIQPLLWLMLFGAVFKNIPLNIFYSDYNYSQFLGCGILVFTCFTGSLNAGLPLVFDREFGFLNRLLVSPLKSKNSIILASMLFIICLTMLQNFSMLIFSLKSFVHIISLQKIQQIIIINILLTITISSLSLGLAFVLPGHVEFLAFILIINLPTLFTSTALAPFYLMPYWLQIVSKFNMLTYAIEALRFIIINKDHNQFIISTFGINFSLSGIILLFIIINVLSITTVTYLVNYRLEE